MSQEHPSPRPSKRTDEDIEDFLAGLHILALRGDAASRVCLDYALEVLYLRRRLRAISREAVEGLAPEARSLKGPRVKRVK